MTVVIIKKDGMSTCYRGISRISPLFNGKDLCLLKDLTPKEMELYNRNPDEDEDFMAIKVENYSESTILIQP